MKYSNNKLLSSELLLFAQQAFYFMIAGKFSRISLLSDANGFEALCTGALS
jgi:hypothetical protein